MSYKITKLFVAFLFSTSLSGLQAQENTVSASGNASGIEGTVSYSVGQVAYLTKSGTEGTITEGIQQPFEILIPTGIEDEKGITLECLLYPNPSDEFVKLKIENRDINNLGYHLLNMNGVLLQTMKISDKETLISMDGLEKSTYILVITQNEKVLKTFQVIKK
jgi:hypothetical protein